MSDIPTQIREAIHPTHLQQHRPDPRHDHRHPSATTSALDSIDYDDGSDEDIPLSALQPRAAQLYPIPDLRFEQSYLHSIVGAETWWKVAWITLVHQVVMPFVQGVGWNLAVFGWRHWNKNVKLHGDAVGVRARRWWWRVNDWKIPPPRQPLKKTN